MSTYLITGASRGIGRALSLRLSKDGHEVLAIARDAGALQALEKECGCRVLAFDLERPDWDVFREWVGSHSPLDGMIHNAGFLKSTAFMELDAELVKRHYEINVLSAFGLFQAVLPHASIQAHFLTIGTIGGMTGSSKFPGLSAYSSSKAALSTLTECLQVEFPERNWTFNSLALGAVSTEMLREAFPEYEAPIQPDQIAQFISNFLISGHLAVKGKVLPVSMSNP
ncbi:MAG: 3-oxoacyl-[acyl-carrier-protein] reductase FabG [Flavobacteriia bacterium]|nr:MAG: 3-oxoacyl-[acyl-carrier-protein] reductase FabG [Flavobacteriia bacterium]